ncbi:MAG: rhomboid family intramembrane serine protease [Muribaculaceae bacterium]|nr:rhomboid family intramembrane serine protease [Muribaculaceae bacterium]
MAAFTDWLNKFKTASSVWKLLIINIVVFLLLRLLGIIAMIGGWDIDNVVDELALPSVPHLAAQRPWTILTYMFTHYAPFHLLFNMLALSWFGRLMTWRCSERQMVWLYFYGGIAGAVFYFIAAQLFPGVGGWLLGASASVIAIVIATAFMMPDYPVMLLLFGNVKLKWIAVAAVILFGLGLVGDNAGAHVAHFGGIAMGALFGYLINRGIDITRPASRAYDRITAFFRPSSPLSRKKFRPRKKQTKKTTTITSEENDRRNLDAILDKIKHSGYTALTPDERRQLFDISKRVK